MARDGVVGCRPAEPRTWVLPRCRLFLSTSTLCTTRLVEQQIQRKSKSQQEPCTQARERDGAQPRRKGHLLRCWRRPLLVRLSGRAQLRRRRRRRLDLLFRHGPAARRRPGLTAAAMPGHRRHPAASSSPPYPAAATPLDTGMGRGGRGGLVLSILVVFVESREGGEGGGKGSERGGGARWRARERREAALVRGISRSSERGKQKSEAGQAPLPVWARNRPAAL